MKSNSIETWSQDGLMTASRYKQKIAEEGINSAKSLGEKTSEKGWEFHSLLWKNVSLEGAVSILDIGCGKAELLAFLKNNYSEIKIERYLGIDLVKEFLDVAQLNYPEYEFRLQNFISDQFLPNRTFNIVLATGVLISRVNNYQKFVECFIRKMVQCGSSHILFNLISEIDLSSQNYLNHDRLGRSTSFFRTTLKSILENIKNTSDRIVESRIFPDATDMFVHICIEKEK